MKKFEMNLVSMIKSNKYNYIASLFIIKQILKNIFYELKKKKYKKMGKPWIEHGPTEPQSVMLTITTLTLSFLNFTY